MSVKKYSYPEQKDEKLSDNFKVGEFFQRDTYVGCGKLTQEGLEKYNEVLIDNRLIDILEGLRKLYASFYDGKCTISLTPHGGYRPTALNTAVGGANGSQHKRGTAADIVVRIDGKVMDVPTSAVLAESYMAKVGCKGGVGVYAASHSHFHVDVRGKWAAWYCSYSGAKCPAQGGRLCIFRRGDEAAGIMLIQRRLNEVGYDCGTPDGIFGSKTEAAVKKLQLNNGLTRDGVYGKLTNAKLGALPWDC